MPENITLTKEDLKEILGAVVEAAKAPTPIEQAELDQQARELRAKNEERLTNAASVRAEQEAKRAVQMACTHEHSDGHTHAVFIQEPKGPGYFLCQLNQCKIRPEIPEKERRDKGAIYDTREFNRLFQKSPSNELFG